MRFLTYKTVRLLLPHILNGDKILDIGSGLGFQAEQIHKKTGNNIMGIDVLDYRKARISFKQFDGKHIPFDDKSFDVSYLAFVLHHSASPEELLREAMRVTKRTILILEDTPRNWFDRMLDAYHGWSFNAFYNLHNKAIFRTKEEWETLFENFGVKTIISKRLSRFAREPYFPDSRTLFKLELQ